MTRPLALELPLQGRQWIEASAGTGKTFTLSLLVLRLLLEREIHLPNILAVTFTTAATQELKIKIRAQIKLAQDLLKQGLPENLAGLNAGQYATASLLQSLLTEKSDKHLQQMLELAIQDCDRAGIFTIHGFCARVLKDHALTAGQILQTPSVLTSTAEINNKIAYDLWREFSADRDLIRSLQMLWPSPELLARQCDNLLRADTLLPTLPMSLPADFDLTALNQQLRFAIEAHLDDAKVLLAQAHRNGIFNKSNMSQSIIDSAFENLENWLDASTDQPFADPDFHRLSASHIAKNVKKAYKQQTPISPLFEAIEAWCQGFKQALVGEEMRKIRCLHHVVARLSERRQALLQKRQNYSYDDLISQLLTALESESGAELCQAIRKDFPVALVDEFQDTDSQQWKIFSLLYPEQLSQHALYLIGDPKQAIYGFRGGDVHAYLAAKRDAQSQWNLPENFRSRPGLLSAVATLFGQGGENAFREPDIHFYPVLAGGGVADSDFIWADKPAPAMQLALLPEYIHPKDQTAADLPAATSRALATRACVEKIHALLLDGQQNQARLKDPESGNFRGVEPGDIAVLVNKNKEAIQIQTALAACGIASVVSSQENLFATLEAQELRVVLDALIKHQDSARWRGALSTVLLGYNADDIMQLESDDVAASRSAKLAIQYRDTLLQHGILSVVTEICAAAAGRILPLADGERRLSNYLQLAETMQNANAQTLSPEQCLRWLVQAMQEASVEEENTLRLDSDQKRVKILTLHKSKGLEFPLVFMPFGNAGNGAKPGVGLALLNYHEQHQRITHALVYNDKKADIVTAIKARAAEERLAEQVRLLYVGLTRAQYYCWVCCGVVYQADTSGLSSLLFTNSQGMVTTPGYGDFLARLKNISRDNQHIVIDELNYQKRALSRFVDAGRTHAILICKPTTHIEQDWRVLSFSQLTHASRHQSPSTTAAADEAESVYSHLSEPEEIIDKRFSGIAFGNALHHALENTQVSVWAEHGDADMAPESELPLLQQALLRQGYLQEELAAGTPPLASLVFNTLRARLPEGVRLCDLPEQSRLNEMEFHFSLRACESRQLLALLQENGILLQRTEFPFVARLNGLMTGKIDLIYQHAGRFYVCDYKSNRLPAYNAIHCEQAMRDSEYDFQALIYTVALHRWCKFRLKENYDYDKHIGGVRYLFSRGLKADESHGDGIVAMRFQRPFIEALEALLHPQLEVLQ